MLPIRLDVKADHAIMLACFGNIVVKGILRITRGIGRSYAQKILPGRERIHGKLWQDQILLPKNVVVNR